MCQAGPDYRQGDEHPHIAIIGACPGRQEEEAGRPFIGPTGANLALMVPIINGISPVKFPSANRDDYTLLNAHPLPRYQVQGQPKVRTQPTKTEILDVNNVARLIQQLQSTNIARVILAGKKPGLLVGCIRVSMPAIEIFLCGHPSTSSWNTRYVGQSQADKLRNWTHDTFEMVEPFHVIA